MRVGGQGSSSGFREVVVNPSRACLWNSSHLQERRVRHLPTSSTSQARPTLKHDEPLANCDPSPEQTAAVRSRIPNFTLWNHIQTFRYRRLLADVSRKKDPVSILAPAGGQVVLAGGSSGTSHVGSVEVALARVRSHFDCVPCGHRRS